jgi:hypothetical protein
VFGRVRIVRALALALVAALSCGDDRMLSWEEFCVQMSAREVARRLECGLLWAPIAPSMHRSPLCDGLPLASERGAVAFRAENASACLVAISSMSCADVADVAAGLRVSCPAVLAGARAPGDRCRNPWECADSEHNTCEVLGPVCEATCFAKRGPGEPCQTSSDCVWGASCQLGCPAGATSCTTPTGTCVRRAEEGEACGPGQGFCAPHLHCGASGVCAARPSSGPCTGTFGVCSPASVCQMTPTGERACVARKGPGDACQPGECSAGLCGPDDSGGVCTQPPRLGDRCGYVLRDLTVIGFLSCVDGWCDRPRGAPEGTCRPPHRAGDACVTGDECPNAWGVFCLYGVCQEIACPE